MAETARKCVITSYSIHYTKLYERFTDQSAGKAGTIPYINDRYLADEQALVRELVEAADAGENMRAKIQETAAQLVRARNNFV